MISSRQFPLGGTEQKDESQDKSKTICKCTTKEGLNKQIVRKNKMFYFNKPVM